MAEIVIDKWYGKEKTDLLSKNTISKVEFIEQNTEAVGGIVYDKTLWLWEKISLQDFLDAGFSSMQMSPNTGSNNNTAWADNIRTNLSETLGNGTISFKNIYGDMSALNYAVTVKCSYRQSGTTSFYIYDFLKGSFVTPESANPEQIAGQIGIAFSGDNIVLSLSNMLLYGDYFLSYTDSPQYNSQRNFKPWYYQIKVVYGGLQTSEEKISYGAGENSIKFDKNSLIEKHTTINNVPVSQIIAENILSEYANGKQAISLTVLCDKFKDENDNTVIDLSSEDENVKHLIEIGDTFILRKRGINLYPREDGSPRKFLVTKANLSYHGKPKMLIEGVAV